MRSVRAFRRFAIRSSGQPRWRAIMVMFCSAVRWGNSPPAWMTYPMRRRRVSALAAVTASPSKATVPVSGAISPFIRRSRVDLPHPLGPIRTVVRPRGTSRSVGATARVAPNDLATCERLNMNRITAEAVWTCKRVRPWAGSRCHHIRRSRENTSNRIDSTMKQADRYSTSLVKPPSRSAP